MKKYFYLLILLAFVLSYCTEPKKTTVAIDKANMDLSVKPGTDFDKYANGGWKKAHPIPADRNTYGTSDELAEMAQTQMRSLIDEIISKKQETGSIGQKISDFYKTGMDTVKIEAEGLKSIQGFFDRINSVKSTDDLIARIAELHTYNIFPLFEVDWTADYKNSDVNITYLGQGGLGLPNRDFYTMTDAKSRQIQLQYNDHMKKMFMLLGNDSINAKKNMEKVYSMELRMAQASMTKVEQRELTRIYNKKDFNQLVELAPSINWTSYFELLGVGNPGNVVVLQPAFMIEASKMVKEIPLDDWKVYLRWNVINKMARYLNKAFVDQDFEFFDHVLSGNQKQQPRWKKLTSQASLLMSEAVGQIYVAKYFPPEAKKRMLNLVENLRSALGERIRNASWMSDTTEQKALEKLAAIRVKIGYPDKWRDYSKLEIKDDSYVLNILRGRQFNFNYKADKMNKPVDKSSWSMSPQTVNAYYSPTKNEIVFPAAILQPPFFYMDADDAVNYGAIGVVIGHELSHGFDNFGRQFDKNGNLTDWWTKADAKRFEERSEVLVKQYNQYKVGDSLHVNGKLTLGENIGDLGGLYTSYTAFKKVLKDNKPIDGFTPEQRFFLAFSHIWAENMHQQELIKQTLTDVHPCGYLRAFAPLRNMPEFYQAFDVKEGDFMFLPETQRAIIW